MGIKNVFKLEGGINSRDCCFKFLNRSLPNFSNGLCNSGTQEQNLIKVTAQFVDEISGLDVIKILEGGTQSALLIKLKFMCNTAIIDMVNSGTETMIFRPEEMIGIVDLRSLGY